MAVTSMLATDVPQVAVQLLLTAAWLWAADSEDIKPLVSPAGTTMMNLVVPAVASFIVTLEAVAEVLAITNPYRSKKVLATAVTMVVSATDEVMVVLWTPLRSRIEPTTTCLPNLSASAPTRLPVVAAVGFEVLARSPL